MADTSGIGETVQATEGRKAACKESKEVKSDILREIKKYQRCAVEDRKFMPAKPGVYFLMQGRKCLYVGQSINLCGRWVSHGKLSELESLKGVFIAWKRTAKKELNFLEWYLIETLKPRLNRQPNRIYVPPPGGDDLIKSQIRLLLFEPDPEQEATKYVKQPRGRPRIKKVKAK